jgi:NAD(P)-dependent dehydrogenase (short-subunit alcohol dehydrogenase family)
MGRLDGKVALITGAAGSIGAATARLFLAEGARVVLVDVAPIAQVDNAIVLQRDVTDPQAVERAVELAITHYGGLDVAFANAGVFGVVAPVTDYPLEEFQRVLQVNVVGPFLVAQHALRRMRDGGSLIINSSVVGLTSDARIAGYATSKHAVVGLMRTAAKEVAHRGIRVNTIHPGPVDNDFQHRIETTATGQDEADAARIFEQMIPLARHATPEEIAQVVLFLASDESRFVTGATLQVDGGMSI